jgi:hypothetical protein
MNNHFDGVMKLLSQGEDDVQRFADAVSQLAHHLSSTLLTIILWLAEDGVTPSTGRRPQKAENVYPRYPRSSEL